MNYQNYLSRLESTVARPIDSAFADFLQSLEPNNPVISWLGYVLSAQLGKGHVCLDFAQTHEHLNQDELQLLKANAQTSEIVFQAQSQSTKGVLQDLPLVLDGDRLYLQRYWLYESQLQLCIEQGLTENKWDLLQEKSFIQQLFLLNDENNTVNWQAIAACIAAKHGFSVISGGPGTGKTTTVIRLLALLVKLHQSQLHHQPIIKLVAPTGKAAMRLTESISLAKQKLDVDDKIKSAISEQTSTIHRLLQSNGRGGFRYDAHNPLHLDVLVVDEASMVDLPLMTKLLQALPSHAQVVLLGDKDQLASVEAGSVLADICDGNTLHGYDQNTRNDLQSILKMDLAPYSQEQGAQLRQHICHLRKSYRFHEQSGIGYLAAAANAGDAQQWQQVLAKGYSDLTLLDLSDANFDQFTQQAVSIYGQYIQTIKINAVTGLSDEQALEVHQQFNRFQVLCALREGPLGVSGLNERIEQGLSKKGQIETESVWYLGRPVMIMQNDYGVNLYNGDIGLILPRQEASGEIKLKAVFVGTDQQVRWLQPSRLPQHETVYAMTVHKSQGSEFDHCAFVLPDYDTQVLSKELIYTGITRAKSHLTCISHPKVLQQALTRQVQRASGLRDRLWRQLSSVDVTAQTSGSDDSQYSLF
ncbi:exodeoxyribonuclease V subunit alpha [Oceaniserpentilla sp. 4NH20-0058]|uniref:exodeoxyribonuclease V subunit alpha n=1 Tax=Oceaniserpentilla sp. 4NH20-0058 TaxID=3127660 RepID=UPI00310AD44C